MISRLRPLIIEERRPAAAAVGVLFALYLLLLLALPVVSRAALAWAALAGALGVALVIHREAPAGGQLDPGRLAGDPLLLLAAWIPLHLVLLVTGSSASPVAAVLVLWVLLLVRAAGGAGLAGAAAAVALLLLAEGGDSDGLAGIRALAALVVGGGAGVLFRAGAGAASAAGRGTESAPGRGPRAAGAAALPSPDSRAEEARALENVAEHLGAERVVVWDVDVAREMAVPRMVLGGRWPPALAAAGDPLLWAATEGIPLRLDHAPRWAPDAATAGVARVSGDPERAAVASFEFGADSEPPSAEVLEEAALYLRAFLRMSRREYEARARQEMYEEALEVLRRLPEELELGRFAGELCRSAMRLTGGTGAAVALWDGEAGEVVELEGEDGGPPPGTRFGALEGEMGLCARAGAVIVREDRWTPDALPIASGEESWITSPRVAALVPLEDPARSVVGVLAVWTGSGMTLQATGLQAVETLAPYVALLLENASEYSRLRTQAERDPLTGIHNRRSFDERLQQEEARFGRYHRPCALLLIDLDHFKSVNDAHGHEAGDQVLTEVAAVLGSTVRETDFPARLGGEEFVVLLPETRLAEAVEAGERIRARVEELDVAIGEEAIPVRVSIGVSACPECVPSPAGLVGSADRMLYAAKEAGRNRVAAASPP